MSRDEILQQWLGLSWYDAMKKDGLLDSPDFHGVAEFVARERKEGVVYPSREDVFKALRLCPLDMTKVVILGQDPYHDGSADGLAFSNAGKLYPSPSLKNVLVEVEECYEGKIDMMQPSFYNLSRWATQGVLLLNAALTVRRSSPGSHAKQWQPFIASVMNILSSQERAIVFMLWGRESQKFQKYIDPFRHFVLLTDHPQAPNYGSRNAKLWFGNRHFLIANDRLKETYGEGSEIKWEQV
jgi:uracil-DNA glycosylase